MQIGRTERVLNNLNPNFAKSFQIVYAFEEVQRLKFSIFDIDSESQRLTEHDFLGEIEVTLGQVYKCISFSYAYINNYLFIIISYNLYCSILITFEKLHFDKLDRGI